MFYPILSYLVIILYPITIYFAFRQYSVWRVLLVLDVIALTILDLITLYGILISVFMVSLSIGYSKINEKWQRISQVFIVVVVLLLGFHIIPGFERVYFFNNYTFSNLSPSFNIGVSLDKAFGAILLLGFGIVKTKIHLANLKLILLHVAGISLVVGLFSTWGEYFAIDIKFTWPILIWAYGNLFVTCIAEEAFFRGIIQHQVYEKFCSKLRFGSEIAILFSATVFALAHFAGGINYIIISFIAGIGYGLIYAKTKNLLDSILVHFLSNMVHIIFFTYPFLLKP